MGSDPVCVSQVRRHRHFVSANYVVAYALTHGRRALWAVRLRGWGRPLGLRLRKKERARYDIDVGEVFEEALCPPLQPEPVGAVVGELLRWWWFGSGLVVVWWVFWWW